MGVVAAVAWVPSLALEFPHTAVAKTKNKKQKTNQQNQTKRLAGKVGVTGVWRKCGVSVCFCFWGECSEPRSLFQLRLFQGKPLSRTPISLSLCLVSCSSQVTSEKWLQSKWGWGRLRDIGGGRGSTLSAVAFSDFPEN